MDHSRTVAAPECANQWQAGHAVGKGCCCPGPTATQLWDLFTLNHHPACPFYDMVWPAWAGAVHPVMWLVHLVLVEVLVLMRSGAIFASWWAAVNINRIVELSIRDLRCSCCGVAQELGEHANGQLRRIFTIWRRFVLHFLFGTFQVLPWMLWTVLFVLRSGVAAGKMQDPGVVLYFLHGAYASAAGYAVWQAPYHIGAKQAAVFRELDASGNLSAHARTRPHAVYDLLDVIDSVVLFLVSCMIGLLSIVCYCIWCLTAAACQAVYRLATNGVLQLVVLGCIVVLHSISLPWQHTLTAYTQYWYMQEPWLLAGAQLVGLKLLMSFWAPMLQEQAAAHQPAAAPATQRSDSTVVGVVQWVLTCMLAVNQCAGFACHHPASYQPRSKAGPELSVNDTTGFAVGCWQFLLVALYLAMHVPVAARWVLKAVRWVSGVLFCLACRTGNPWLGTLSSAWLVFAAVSFWADIVMVGLAFAAPVPGAVLMFRLKWYGPYVYGSVFGSFVLLHVFSWRAHIRRCAEQALLPVKALGGCIATVAAPARACTPERGSQPAPPAPAASSSSRASKVPASTEEHREFSSRVEALKADAQEEVTTCTLCCEAPRSVCVKPCGHLICCEPCFRRLQKNAGQGAKKKGGSSKLLCPVCKEVVREHVAGIRL